MNAESLRKIAWRATLWLAVAVAAVVLYQRAAAVPEPMEAEDLARTSRTLSSDAREASALARALATGQLTLRFAVSQHEHLAQDLEDVRKELDRPPPKGLEEKAQRLREAAQRLGEVLTEVPLHMADAQAMSRISADEEGIAADIGAGDGS